jgi:hypothetical protein
VRLGSVVVFMVAFISCRVSLCGLLLEVGVMDVVFLGRVLGWIVGGCALGGIAFVLVLEVSYMMMFLTWVSSSPVRVYRR